MSNLERVVEDAVMELRSRLAAANIGSDFRLDIEASGRIQGGQIKIAYVLSGTMYGTNEARGNRLAPVIDEFLRRQGLNHANEPLAIGYEPPAPPVIDV